MAAYRALFKSVDEVNGAKNIRALQVPAVVFVDKNDELVSYSRMKDFIHQRGLKNWHLKSLAIDGHYAGWLPIKHHLIFDKTITGSKVWRQVWTAIRHLIFP